ncbi:MAG: FecR domain-containing protein [Bacteroidota bacterium]|nr:FecR domain-containing protein [Bacteroidota bacterium]
MNIDKNNIEELFLRYYSGESTIEEENQILDRINSDPEIKKKFQMYDFDYHSDLASTNDSWNNLDMKLLHPKKPNKIRLQLIQFARYAAIFILAFISYWTFNKYSGPNLNNAFYKTIVPKGQKAQLELPDGSKVWINSESSLRYSANFNKDNREVELEGEAYFQVTHNNRQPFIVKTHDYKIKDIGTEFNVMAYSDFKRTETTLVKGNVEILNNASIHVCALKPGEKVSYDREKGSYSIDIRDTALETAWKDNIFVFEDIPFNELCTRLSRWYDVTVILKDKSLYDIRYTGKFKNKETIWQVLDIIKTTTTIDYNLNDRKLTIFKKH